MLAIVIAEGVAIVVLAGLVIGLLRSHAEILRSLHELGAGAELGSGAPGPVPVRIGARTGVDISGTMADGSAAAVGIVGSPHNTLLAFLSTTCTTCLPFWEAFAQGPGLPENTRLVVVLHDEDSDKRLAALAAPDLLVLKSTAAWEAYEIPGSPHFVLVEGSSGRIRGEGTAATLPAVLDLLEQAGGIDLTHRDNAQRIDAELAAAGITAGHSSLYQPLDPES